MQAALMEQRRAQVLGNLEAAVARLENRGKSREARAMDWARRSLEGGDAAPIRALRPSRPKTMRRRSLASENWRCWIQTMGLTVLLKV